MKPMRDPIINLDTFEVNDLAGGAGQVQIFESPTDTFSSPTPDSYQSAFNPENKNTFSPSSGGVGSVTSLLTKGYGGRAESTLTQPLIFGQPVSNNVEQKISPIWFAVAGFAIYFYFFKKRRA